MLWRMWAASLGFAVATGFVAWSLLGLLDLPTWLAALLVVVAVAVLGPPIAWFVCVPVAGNVAGFWDRLRGLPADEELLEPFRSMSINDVRRRADDFDRRAVAAEQGRSRAERKRAATYRAPAEWWRRLEVAMRDAHAFDVEDLPDEEVERWGQWLGLWRDDRPWPPREGPARPEPQRRTAHVPTTYPQFSGTVRGGPTGPRSTPAGPGAIAPIAVEPSSEQDVLATGSHSVRATRFNRSEIEAAVVRRARDLDLDLRLQESDPSWLRRDFEVSISGSSEAIRDFADWLGSLREGSGGDAG